MKPRTFAYSRVSTPEQFATRLSIEEQQRQIKAFCEKEGLDLGPNDVRLGEEAASAYKLNFMERPLGSALNQNMQPGDHIVIAKLDRAFRDMRDAFNTVQHWQDRKIVVHILDLPISGQPIFDRLILGILAWCAEFESHRKSERMADANRSARMMGRPIRQQAPIGFKWVGSRANGTHKLAYYPEEREHMRLCYELYIDQDLSLYEISSYLMCNKIVPYDKRRKDSQAASKIKVPKEYHPQRITQMIGAEAEFRYFEDQGHSPEVAAGEWLKAWGQGKLPTREELEDAVVGK